MVKLAFLHLEILDLHEDLSWNSESEQEDSALKGACT